MNNKIDGNNNRPYGSFSRNPDYNLESNMNSKQSNRHDSFALRTTVGEIKKNNHH